MTQVYDIAVCVSIIISARCCHTAMLQYANKESNTVRQAVALYAACSKQVLALKCTAAAEALAAYITTSHHLLCLID
jgi:hypothetical protein